MILNPFHGDLWIGANYTKCWQRGGLCVYENGGRKLGECFDLNFQVWKFSIWFTFTNINHMAKLLRFLPDKKLKFGFHPIGCK